MRSLPLMQARVSPSRRALLGPGRRTGSSTGKGATAVLALGPGPAAAVLALAAPAPAGDIAPVPPLRLPRRESRSPVRQPNASPQSRWSRTRSHWQRGRRAATAVATGRKNDQGVNSSRKSRRFMPCPPLFAERSAFTSGAVSHPTRLGTSTQSVAAGCWRSTCINRSICLIRGSRKRRAKVEGPVLPDFSDRLSLLSSKRLLPAFAFRFFFDTRRLSQQPLAVRKNREPFVGKQDHHGHQPRPWCA